jgi:hypothetical protein
MITDFFSGELRAMSRELASSRIEEPKLTQPRSHRKLLKEREDETSQLNRLVFLGEYFPWKVIGAQLSASYFPPYPAKFCWRRNCFQFQLRF